MSTISLKSVSEYATDVKLLQIKKKKETLRYRVEQFIHNKLRIEIERAIKEYLKQLIDGKSDNRLYAMVEVPSYYYSTKEQFLNICKEIMRPLGYNVTESHDGAGMYATIQVDWTMPKDTK